MRMLVTLEFADAGTKSGIHRVLIIGRDTDDLQAGDIGLSLDEAKTLVNAVQQEFVSGQAAEIVDNRRRCDCGKKLQYQGLENCAAYTQYWVVCTCRARDLSAGPATEVRKGRYLRSKAG
jgi:hypothetical protein